MSNDLSVPPQAWARAVVDRLAVDAAVILVFGRPQKPEGKCDWGVAGAVAAPADEEALSAWLEVLDVEIACQVLDTPMLASLGGRETDLPCLPDRQADRQGGGDEVQ